MKKIIFLLIILNLSSCNPSDCFESTGAIIKKEYTVANFDKIEVGNEVSLIIKYGAEQKVVLETGKNLIDNVTIEVIDGELFLKDESSCNLNREYAVTKVYVTSPNINVIRSNTARTIRSEGVLYFNNLNLVSEDYQNSSLLNIGDFDLDIDNNKITISSNGNSLFKIRGKTNNIFIGFYSGSTRFEGKNLIAQKVNITQKSTNDIIINPQQWVKGTIFSIGDVVAYNHPPIIELEELYNGTLIFK